MPCTLLSDAQCIWPLVSLLSLTCTVPLPSLSTAVDKALEHLVPIEIPAGWGKDEVRVLMQLCRNGRLMNAALWCHALIRLLLVLVPCDQRSFV